MEIKLASYGVLSSSAVLDPSTLPLVREYKRQVASRMMPLDRREISKRIPAAEYYASKKIDGEFTVLVYRDKEIFSINPGGTVRVGLPMLDEATKRLQDSGVKDAMIAGELFVQGDEGKRERVHDVVRVARAPTSEQDLKQLQFRTFDWINFNGNSIANYAANWEQLQRVFDAGELIRPVDTVLAKNCADVESLFHSLVEEGGAEGVVLRSESAGAFKIKPRHTLDAAVIGFTESTGDRTGMIHDLLLALMRTEGTLHVLCRVGGGFSEELRRELLSDLKDHIVSSEYAEVNSDRVAYQMVEPRLVAEISCLDVFSQSTRNAPINRMTLDWDRSSKTYRVVRRLPLVSVISPQFVQMREDKKVNVHDIRIEQVANIVDIPQIELDSRQMSLPKSSLLKREVYTKQTKGETMVRKFVMWQTNKGSVSTDFPEYVVHFTDFSPNRATPLAREVRVSNSLEQIENLWNEMKEENVKKGWELRSDPME
jgi:hypothetical protein